MQIFRGFHHPAGVAPACALTIGNFDGVHRGHQAVLGRALEEACRRNVPALALTFAATAANAQASCSKEATTKNLNGAAKTSFLKKCETDAKASCEKQATDKKLSGAAKTSFTTKCVKDAA